MLVVIGVLASMLIPNVDSTVPTSLSGAAQVIVADLAYARSLAVTNGSRYRIEFRPSGNEYVLRHSGTNPALHKLPATPYRSPSDPANEQHQHLDLLPVNGPVVRLVRAESLVSVALPVGDVEFGPLGGTTRVQATRIWLSSGRGSNQRYISITVDPVTGLASIGDIRATGP